MEPHHHQHEHHHHDPAPAPDWSPEPFSAPVAPTSSEWPSAPDTSWAGSPNNGWASTPDTSWTGSPDTGHQGGGWAGSPAGRVVPASQWLPTYAPTTTAARRPVGSATLGTTALVCALASVLVGFCDFGILAVAAIVLGATHRRRVGLGGPGRRRSLAGIIIGAIVVLPSLILSVGFFLQ